jgi:hypothetical protein
VMRSTTGAGDDGAAECITAGLVGGEGFAVDASLIAADANKQRSIPASEWSKAVRTTPTNAVAFAANHQ